uniref:Uncharacterized protein n=1 Tax=Arion vulgaris TaxID=1028688 RepID=A0A0B6ZSX2_9EUPU
MSKVLPTAGINLSNEWVPLPVDTNITIFIYITLNRSCAEHAPIMVNTEVMAMVDRDTVVYTDGSLIRDKESAQAFQGG